MRKDQVKLSQVHDIPELGFAGTFTNHMKFGDKSGLSHSGLHILSEFKKANNLPLGTADIVTGNSYTGTLNGRQTTVTIGEVDLRAKTFLASVNIYGTAKTSTFFPVGTTLDKAKEYMKAAWKDHCTYGTSDYGGGDVDIYKDMRKRFGLNWVGMAKIAGQDIWVGSAYSGAVVTAFPAVNNKFA